MNKPIFQLKRTTYLLLSFFVIALYFVANSCQQAESPKTDVERGQELYIAYCEICHGSKGVEGAMASMLKVPPPDLTKISERRNGEFPEEELYKIIDGQKALESGHGNRTMPIWGEIFSKTENVDQVMVPKKIYQLIAYLETIQQ